MKPQPLPPKAHSEIEIVRLVWLAIFISVFSFLYYNRQGEVLLYGDAVAHINIARRIFDSRTPGLLQLGTVWLPLPHLLILPFIISNNMWQSGAGGSIPSMAAFVLGTLGIFRLVRITLGSDKSLESATSPGTAKIGTAQVLNGKSAAWISAILYAANPNLIYMQSTAMGESLYLAFFIWAVAYFAESLRGTSKALLKCALCLFAACLTRYDGWFLAALLMASILLLEFRSPIKTKNSKLPIRLSRSQIAKFLLIAAAGPIIWLGYNAAVYRNPLEFANGPYSAKSIELKTATVNPAKGNLFAAASYFLKAAELNVAESTWLGRLWLALALVGTVSAARSASRRILLSLCIPLPFYALSIAFGSVPIFVPHWWPFAQYNVRYGLQLLPAFAVFVPLGISFLSQQATNFPQIPASWRRWMSPATALATLLIVAASYAAIWRAEPICFREANINMKGALALDRQLGEWLKSLPANSTLLMYLGEHVGVLERAGIPLRRTINEGNHSVWKSPFDPEGLWERALADPAAFADVVIGFEGDPVWTSARAHNLTALVEIHTTGQPSAVIFQGKTQPPPSAR
jgi:hypothetical protein